MLKAKRTDATFLPVTSSSWSVIPKSDIRHSRAGVSKLSCRTTI